MFIIKKLITFALLFENGDMDKIYRQYDIHFVGLLLGQHNFQFEADEKFFALFPESPVKTGDVKVELQFDKQTAHFELKFNLQGHVQVECDRCTATINYPVINTFTLYVKFEDENISIENEPEDLIYISRTESTLNVAQYIYEFIIISLPIVKNCDFLEEKYKNCNQEILKKLNESNSAANSNAENIWAGLKNIKLN